MNGAILNGRYRLDGELGQGGMGVVYWGHDLLLGRDVAVKVLNKAGLGTSGRTRLLREAQAVARLNHPNIVTLYDAGEADNVPFIVMELLTGMSLYDRKAASIEELIEISRQVCEALAHAHAHGIVHRDLKPENVIISGHRSTNGGSGDLRVKLTDFGLARSLTTRESTEGGLVGTVFYLPPEQALGRELDGRADLYSLGVMLYELTAGRLPFAGDDPLTVISQHLHAPPVPPGAYNPEIPAPLEALILKLMSKQPDDRPASAAEVAHTLDRILRKSTDLIMAAAEASELSPLDRLVRGRLVGRDTELAEVRLAWQRATTEQDDEAPHLLLLAGESGVGKTPFVRALRALAEVSRGRWLHGECYAQGGAPYAPFDQALSPLFVEPGVELQLSPAILADLTRLAPALQVRLPAQAPVHEPARSPQGEQQHLFESVVATCEAVIATGRGHTPGPTPLMLVIEDVQWADAATLALLRHLARRARTARLKLFIVLTFRPSEAAQPGALHDLLLDCTRERLATRVDLTPFNSEQTAELLEVMFQQKPPAPFVTAIYNETEGNLFYIEEVCKALIEDGTLHRNGPAWQFPDELCCEALPSSVRLTVQARIGKLATETQEVLRLGAVIGREFDFATLQRCSDFDEETLIAALEEAQRAQLILELPHARGRNGSLNGERFRYAHGLVVASLRDSLSGLRRRRLHRRVAEIIEAAQGDNHTALAYHYAEGGDEEQARRHLRAAGDAALRAYAGREALDAYSNALRLTPAPTAERFDLLLARVQIPGMLRQPADQTRDIDELAALAETLDDDERRFEAWLARAEHDLNTQYLNARESAEHAVEIARRMGDIAREGRALVCLGLDARLHGDLERSRTALELAAQRLREGGLACEAALCLHTLSLTLGDLREYGPALAAAEESVRLSRSAGDKRQEGVGLRRLAIVYMEQRQFAEALPHAEASLLLNREVGDPAEECHAHNVLGILKAYLGQAVAAEAHWREGLRIAEALESVVGAIFNLENMTMLHFAWRGEYLAGIALIEEHLRRPYLRDNLNARVALRERIASFLSILGQHSAALAIWEEVLPLARSLLEKGILTPAVITAMQATYGKLLVQAGQREAGLSTLRAALDALLQDDWQKQDGATLERWAQVMADSGTEVERRRAVELLERALLTFANSAPWNYDTAAARRVLAELYLGLGQPERALNTAQVAIRDFGIRQYGIERYHYTLACALRANGLVDEADAALGRAYQRVLLVASRTPDPAYQQSWLEQTPVNRAIIAWSEGMNQPGEEVETH